MENLIGKVGKFIVKGLSPLLTNNPIGLVAVKDARGKTEILPPDESAERSSYRNSDGLLCIPSAGFRSGIVKAAGSFKLGRGSYKTTAAHIQAEDEYLPLLDAVTMKPINDFTIDSRRVVIGKAGIIRHRARFEEWAVIVPIVYQSDLISADILQGMLSDAGSRFGVGDFRPERGGWFGRYSVMV